MIVIEANGARMPALGFGTSGLKGEVAAAMVEHALDGGIDGGFELRVLSL